MPATISKGRMFRVTSEVSDERLRAMRKAPELASESLQAGADYWHTKILPRHFDSDAHGRYGYAPRAKNYLSGRNKSGKPDLVFSGSLRRDLKNRAAFQRSGTAVELKMSAHVLNFCPRIPENDPDLFVKGKRGKRGYPNLKREIKEITDDERAAVADAITDELGRKFDPAGAPPGALPAGVGALAS